jgi:hypothetical protein
MATSRVVEIIAGISSRGLEPLAQALHEEGVTLEVVNYGRVSRLTPAARIVKELANVLSAIFERYAGQVVDFVLVDEGAYLAAKAIKLRGPEGWRLGKVVVWREGSLRPGGLDAAEHRSRTFRVSFSFPAIGGLRAFGVPRRWPPFVRGMASVLALLPVAQPIRWQRLAPVEVAFRSDWESLGASVSSAITSMSWVQKERVATVGPKVWRELDILDSAASSLGAHMHAAVEGLRVLFGIPVSAPVSLWY